MKEYDYEKVTDRNRCRFHHYKDHGPGHRRPNHSYTLTTAATTQTSLQASSSRSGKRQSVFLTVNARIILTGSGAKPVAEAAGTPYIQEVVANSIALKKTYETVGTAIELGGQDAKIIFFKNGSRGPAL